MKADKILKQVLYLNCIEQQGTIYTGMYKGVCVFAIEYFGDGATVVAGWLDPNTEYFYSYCEPLKGVADCIIEVDECKVYLYKVE